MWQRLLCSFFLATFLTNCAATKVTPKPPILCGILTFESRAGMKAGEAESVMDLFSSLLQNTNRFTVIDRKNLNNVLQEQGFQSTQNGESAVQAGKILAIKKMFSGSIGMLGEKYILNLKMIDTETSQVDFAKSWTYDDDLEDIDEEFLPGIVQEILLVVDGPQKK
jgi:TolB-like protein